MEWAGVEDLEVVVSGGGQVRLFHDDLEDDGFLATASLATHPRIALHYSYSY